MFVMDEIDEGDFVIMLYDYTHTKKKGQLARVTGLHLKDVSVEFADGKVGSYRWSEVRKATEEEIQREKDKIFEKYGKGDLFGNSNS